MTNSITIAPQVSDVPSLFEAWQRSYLGNYSEFISFITRPSGERSRFLMTVEITGALHGYLMFNQVTAVDNA